MLLVPPWAPRLLRIALCSRYDSRLSLMNLYLLNQVAEMKRGDGLQSTSCLEPIQK